MRNQEITSDSSRTATNAQPRRKYGRSITSQHERQQKIRRRESTSEEAADSNERRELPIGQAGNRVPGRAASRVRRAEPHQKPANDDGDESSRGAEGGPTENLTRRQSTEVVNPQRLQIGNGSTREMNDVRRRQPRRQRGAREYPCEKD